MTRYKNPDTWDLYLATWSPYRYSCDACERTMKEEEVWKRPSSFPSTYIGGDATLGHTGWSLRLHWCSEECHDRYYALRREQANARQRDRRARRRRFRATRPCAHCDKPFVPTRSDQRFCTDRCRVAAHRLAEQ